MTWVIGSPTITGYSLILADIQIQVGKGRNARFIDGIQKVHEIGRFLAAGFAGDVEIGFGLIEDLRDYLRLPEGNERAWKPIPTIDSWRQRAQRRFAELGGNQNRAVHLLVGGAWEEDVTPNEADLLVSEIVPIGVRTSASILRSPVFNAEHIKSMRVGSIGSGNEVESYRSALEQMNQNPTELYWGAFIGRSRGSVGTTLGHTLGLDISRTRQPGISPHLLICTVEIGRVLLQPNDSDMWVEGRRVPQRRMPPIARSWPETIELLRRNGFPQAEAMTAFA